MSLYLAGEFLCLYYTFSVPILQHQRGKPVSFQELPAASTRRCWHRNLRAAGRDAAAAPVRPTGLLRRRWAGAARRPPRKRPGTRV